VNTTDFLSIATAICPDREAIVFEEKRQTYAQTSERVNRLSNALLKLGMNRGDRLAVLQVNCPQMLELYFAVATLGGIFVPLNFRAKSDELSYMLTNAKAKFIFAGKRYLDMVRTMLPKLAAIQNCISLETREPDMLGYDDLVTSASPEEVSTDIEDNDITMLLYTAGTTGRPKGVPLRHDGFASYVLGNVEPANPEIVESNLVTVPLYHIAGIQTVMASIYSGRTLVLMRQFEVKEWLETVQRERANRAMLVPTMLKSIIDHPDFDTYDLSSLRVITYGAASMPFEIISKAIKVMPGVQFFNAFGQTETTATIAALGPEDHRIEGTDKEKEKKLKRLAASIGRPLPDVQVKIIDDDGSELPQSQVGVIVIKSPRMMKEYWSDQDKTARAFTPDGWLITNDKGWVDEDGYIFLAGRADDIIIRGGENISPEEVENVLHSHPKVEEAALIGVPDAEWGQQPRAIAVLKPGETATEEEIIDYCSPRLAGFKRPRSVIFVDALPRNQLGKVLRNKLREQYGQP